LPKRCAGEKTKVPEEKLLGPLEVSFKGRGLRFGRKEALALLCYIAAEGGKRPRRELSELLWPKATSGTPDGPAQHPNQAQDMA
jgi:hypothetical protein